MDPQKEIKAASDRVALGISTLEAESILYDGVDWETKYRTRVREQRMMVEGGPAPPLLSHTTEDVVPERE